MISKIKLKTVILSHLVTISNQWYNSILKFTDSKRVKILNSSDTYSDDIDIYIINPIILKKLDFPFEKIGFLIVDEAHSYLSPVISRSYFYFTPKYTLGLSASPDCKKDGTGIMLTHVFGERIYKKLYKEHDVYRLNTGFEPKIVLNEQGKTDWNTVLDSQSTDIERNAKLVKVCTMFHDRNILILCKRKVQANMLLEALKEEKQDVDIYIASQKRANYDCRILICTYKKGGVGFDHPKLDMLVLASDVEMLIDQYIGRIFRGNTNKREIVVDLVDKNSILENHWNTRRTYYKKIGGQIKKFEEHFNLEEEFIVI
jgi:superfamily II DNA or RNA helicase